MDTLLGTVVSMDQPSRKVSTLQQRKNGNDEVQEVEWVLGEFVHTAFKNLEFMVDVVYALGGDKRVSEHSLLRGQSVIRQG